MFFFFFFFFFFLLLFRFSFQMCERIRRPRNQFGVPSRSSCCFCHAVAHLNVNSNGLIYINFFRIFNVGLDIFHF